MVGIEKIGIDADGMLISGKGFLVAFEVAESKAFSIVGIGRVRIDVDGMVES